VNSAAADPEDLDADILRAVALLTWVRAFAAGPHEADGLHEAADELLTSSALTKEAAELMTGLCFAFEALAKAYEAACPAADVAGILRALALSQF
jgi:hypothetical protein